MNKEFKNKQEGLAFIQREKLELSQPSPVIVRHPVGTVLNLTCTGQVMVCETRASREARKDNPQLNRSVYIAHQYSGNDGNVYLLREETAGSKFVATVIETDRKDKDGKPYLAYDLQAVTAAAAPKTKTKAARVN